MSGWDLPGNKQIPVQIPPQSRAFHVRANSKYKTRRVTEMTCRDLAANPHDKTRSTNLTFFQKLIFAPRLGFRKLQAALKGCLLR